MQQIIGNEAVYRALFSARSSDTLCHAYLFYGVQGIGKKTAAAAFAKAILCEHPDQNGACGQCASCRMVENENHPDLYIAPHDKPLPVAAVREIKSRSFVKPNQGEFKVFIIPNADRMEGASYNALLKVLEEPPGNTVFLLTAADKATTPQTVTSRCIPVMLSTLNDAQMNTLLQQKTDASQEMIQKAVEYADGVPGRALSLLSDEQYVKAVGAANALYEALCKRNEYRFLSVLQTAVTDKTVFTKVNEALIGNLRHELLAGGKVSGIPVGVLLGLLECCKETAERLKRPFSLQLLTGSYAAALFACLKEEK